MSDKKTNNKKKSSEGDIKGMKIAFAVIFVLMAGLIGFIVWYTHSDPSVKVGDYKNMKVKVTAGESSPAVQALGGLEINTSDDEKIKQSVLKQLVDEASFRRVDELIDKRYSDFMNYYNQLVALYDEYNSVEELATGYYGYESYDKFCEDVEKYAEASVKQEMVLEKIAELEGFSVTTDIFEQYIGNYLSAYNYKDTPEEREKFLEDYGKDSVYEVILSDYTLDKIIEWTTFE